VRHDQRGAVYVELLLVFLPVFMLFLAVLQLGFVYTGRLVVQHAAGSTSTE
jgi:Flp pilus assembly protein TadG